MTMCLCVTKQLPMCESVIKQPTCTFDCQEMCRGIQVLFCTGMYHPAGHFTVAKYELDNEE